MKCCTGVCQMGYFKGKNCHPWRGFYSFKIKIIVQKLIFGKKIPNQSLNLTIHPINCWIKKSRLPKNFKFKHTMQCNLVYFKYPLSV